MTRRTNAEIGERIQAMRIERKWSKAQLAELANVPVSVLRAMEGGAGIRDEAEGLQLAAAFGCTLVHLMYVPRIPVFVATRWRAPRGLSDDLVAL